MPLTKNLGGFTVSDINRYTMQEELKDSFAESIEYMKESRYPEDILTELADGFVDVYTLGAVDQWRALGCPEIDDAGLVEGVTDIHQIVSMTVFEWASNYLYKLLRDWVALGH